MQYRWWATLQCDSSVAFFHLNNPSYSKQHVTAQRKQDSFWIFLFLKIRQKVAKQIFLSAWTNYPWFSKSFDIKLYSGSNWSGLDLILNAMFSKFRLGLILILIYRTGIPDICNFFYTGRIFQSQILHQTND